MRLRHWIILILGLALLGCATPTARRGASDSAAVRAERAFQQDLVVERQISYTRRLLDIGTPILEANYDLCSESDKTRMGLGLYLLNAEAFSPDLRPSARRQLELGDELRVVHVASGSPAAAAGITVGDTLLSIDDSAAPRGERALRRLLPYLEDALASGSEVSLSLRSSGGQRRTVQILPRPQCEALLIVVSDPQMNAFADGTNIYMTTGMMRFLSDDDQLALVVGHELAHDAMDHIESRTRNSVIGTIFDLLAAGAGVNTGGAFGGMGSIMYSQDFESEADYIGLYMTYRAGYAIEEAPRIWREMVAELGGAGLNNTGYGQTHPSFPERFVALQDAVSEIDRKVADGEPLIPDGMDVAPSDYSDPQRARVAPLRGADMGAVGAAALETEATLEADGDSDGEREDSGGNGDDG
jgi:peptidase M48-like protein/PDZ domain-containing protein